MLNYKSFYIPARTSVDISNKIGQAVLEYSFLLILIVGIITGMSIYVRRALQGRIWDTRNGMINSIGQTYNNSFYSPKMAITEEYEPYYAQSETNGVNDYHDKESLFGGGTTGVFLKTLTGAVAIDSQGAQLPPKEAK